MVSPRFGLGLMLGAAQGTNTAFSPSDIAGLEVWFDASDTGSITDSTGDVTQWNDKSGNARHLTSVIGTPRTGDSTQNGLNVIDFDGTEMLYNSSPFMEANGVGTYFCVFYFDSTGANNGAVIAEGRWTSNVPYFIPFYSTSAQRVGWLVRNDATTSQIGTGSTDVSDLSFHYVSATWDGTNWAFWIDGVSESLTDSTNSAIGTITLDRFCVGARPSGAGGATTDIYGKAGEIIVYDSELSSGDIASIESYLVDKWGL